LRSSIFRRSRTYQQLWIHQQFSIDQQPCEGSLPCASSFLHRPRAAGWVQHHSPAERLVQEQPTRKSANHRQRKSRPPSTALICFGDRRMTGHLEPIPGQFHVVDKHR
jgi:hypothetical protein